MIELRELLKCIFFLLKQTPRIPENFFKVETALIIVSFLYSTLQLFNKSKLKSLVLYVPKSHNVSFEKMRSKVFKNPGKSD